MMATERVGIYGSLFAVDTGFLSIHAVANGRSEANGCHVSIDVLLGRWIEGYYRAGLCC